MKKSHDEEILIDWELCKKLKFDPMNKWLILNLESVLENEKH